MPKKKNDAKKIHTFVKKTLHHTDARSSSSLHEDTTALKERIDRELAEIYGTRDGSLPDMTRFDIKKRHRLLTAVFVLFFSAGLLAAVLWAGFVWWPSQGAFVEEDVIVSVSGAEKVEIGEEVTFRLRYKNVGNTALTHTVIQAQYPEGFVFGSASVTPTGEGNNQWNIGALKKDDGGYIDISGRVYGDIGGDYSIRVFMNYTPENFTSEFQKVAHAVLVLVGSPVDFVVEMPSDLVAGVEVPLTIKLKKQEGKNLPAGSYFLRLDPRGIFTKTKSEPKSEAKDPYLFAIDPNHLDKTITVRGVFTISEGQKPEIGLALIGQPAEKKDKSFVFAETIVPVTVHAADVTVQSIVNGSSGQFLIQPGEKLLTRLVVRNNGKIPLKNAKIRLQLDVPSLEKNSLVDWAQVQDEHDGDILKGEQISDTMRRGQMMWTGKHITELTNLEPGKEIALDLTIPIKNGTQIDLGKVLAYKGELKTDLQYDVENKVQIVSGNTVSMMFQSDVTLDVDHDIHDTKANISWILKNSFHELKNIEIHTDFFGDIAPDEKTVFTPPAGTVAFDEKSKTLVWKIETLPTTVDVLSYEFIMNIKKINPAQTQLTGKIQFEAMDAVTGEKILKVLGPILVN